MGILVAVFGAFTNGACGDDKSANASASSTGVLGATASTGAGGVGPGTGGGTTVSGTGQGGNGGGLACPPGDTTITSSLLSPTPATTATFEVSAACATSFECRLDSAPFAPCASPISLSGLSPGPHTLAVRGVFADATVDATPATWSWRILPPPLQGCEVAGISVVAEAPLRTRYVATTGDDANSGESEALAWRTLAYAATQAKPGDLILVRAGTYSKDPFLLPVDGTAVNPIRLRGYALAPLDEPSLAGLDHTSPLDPTRMPLLDGGDRTKDVGIDLKKRKHVEVMNFQVTGYRHGIDAYGSENIAMERLFVRDVGDRNASYSGKGIVAYTSTRVRVEDSLVVDAAAEGVTVEGTCNVIRRTRVASADASTDDASTDYYITTNGTRNLVEECDVHRVGDLWHPGHGIGIKGCGSENVIRHNKVRHVKGEAYYVRHRAATKNLFQFCDADGEGVGFGFVARDGASENVFEDGSFANGYAGIAFFDTTEDEDANLCVSDSQLDTVVKLGGVKNSFHRIAIQNATAGIQFHFYNQRGARSYGNLFDQLSVEACANLFVVDHLDHDPKGVEPPNALVNSVIKKVPNYVKISASGPYPPNIGEGNVLLSGDRDNAIPLKHVVTRTNVTFTESGLPLP